jgi:hypothetical protein
MNPDGVVEQILKHDLLSQAIIGDILAEFYSVKSLHHQGSDFILNVLQKTPPHMRREVE